MASADRQMIGDTTPVVRALGPLPDADIHALARYLASFSASAPAAQTQARARAVVANAAAQAPLPGPAQRLFDGACSACHHDGNGPTLLGLNVPLALDSKLHGDRPDNLLQLIVHGIPQPSAHDISFIPPPPPGGGRGAAPAAGAGACAGRPCASVNILYIILCQPPVLWRRHWRPGTGMARPHAF